ncbi:MAG: DNA-binding MarR family transcriptional regulator [Candidatus Azotimanducaceae bacterium]|jgi:DNA-binding MarR family transcriptional regulator
MILSRNTMAEPIDQVIASLRQLIRATELHSKQLLKTTGLTTPQLLILRAILERVDVTPGELAAAVSLSQATITNIVDRMEKHGLVTRQRGEADRRRVYVRLTDHARDVLAHSPMPLQEHFNERFQQLQDWEQSQLIASLQRIAQMMDAADISVAPLLTAGLIFEQADLS